MVKKKYSSKRKSLKTKYKIEKKVREAKRKERKKTRAKLLKGGVTQRGSADPGIPNTHPYKEQLLQQLEAQRERAERERQRQKDIRKLQFNKRRGVGAGAAGASVEAMATDAAGASAQFDAAQAAAQREDQSTANQGLGGSSRRAYMRELRKVIEESDVVLEVLDARDPLGCRALSVEQAVLAHGDKKLVLVLNKVDLVPTHVAEGWLAYLRQSHPVVAFKASTQEGGGRLGQIGGDALRLPAEALGRSASAGADMLLQLLKNYSRSLNIKTAISVGIIGYPNVGKSSIINSLKRRRTAGVSPVAGFTKVSQKVQLDKKIRLIDSPGVVFDDSDEGSVLMRNCVNAQSVPDPVGAVGGVLQRCAHEQLMQVYCIPRFDSLDSFLALVARKRGKLARGGVPDKEAAARTVLQDWNAGRVPFFTEPPATAAGAQIADPVIVQQFGMDAVMQAEAATLGNMTRARGDFVAVGGAVVSAGPADFGSDMGGGIAGASAQDEDMQMEVEETPPARPVRPRRSARRG